MVLSLAGRLQVALARICLLLQTDTFSTFGPNYRVSIIAQKKEWDGGGEKKETLLHVPIFSLLTRVQKNPRLVRFQKKKK